MTYQIPEEQLAAASNPLPQSIPRHQPADVDHGILDYVQDFGRGVLRGGVGFGESLVELGDSTAELFGGDLFEGNDLTWKEDLLGENETWVGGLSEGITQFALGFVPAAGVAGKLSKAAKLGRLGQYASVSLGAGAVADFVAFNGHEGRLSDLIEQYPSLQNPISGWLASDEDDSEWEGRVKNALEGLALGPIADVALGGVKLLVGAKKAQAKGGDKAGEDYIKKNGAALLGNIENPLTTKQMRDQLSNLGMGKDEVAGVVSLVKAFAKGRGVDSDTFLGLALSDIERGVVPSADGLFQKGFVDSLPPRIRKGLTPAELDVLEKSKAVTTKAFKDIWDNINSVLPKNSIKTLAKIGESVGGEYARSTRLIRKVYGDDGALLWSALNAASSTRSSVTNHTKFAVFGMKVWEEMGRPIGKLPDNFPRISPDQGTEGARRVGKFTGEPDSIADYIIDVVEARHGVKLMEKGHRVPLRRILNHPEGPLRGAEEFLDKDILKTPSFHGAFQGIFSSMVLDTHMGKIVNLKKLGLDEVDFGNSGHYTAVASRIRQVARELGDVPFELQEKVWSGIIAIDAAKSLGYTKADDILRVLKHDDVRQTWNLVQLATTDPDIRVEFERLGFTAGDIARFDEAARKRKLFHQPKSGSIEGVNARDLERVARQLPGSANGQGAVPIVRNNIRNRLTREAAAQEGAANLRGDSGRVRASMDLENLERRLAAPDSEFYGYTYDPRTGDILDLELVPDGYAVGLHGHERRVPVGASGSTREYVDELADSLADDANLFIGGWLATTADGAKPAHVMDLSTVFRGTLDEAAEFARSHGQESIWDGSRTHNVFHKDDTINLERALEIRKLIEDGTITPGTVQKDVHLPAEAASPVAKDVDTLKQEFGETTKGEITFQDDARAVIRLFKDADVSTVVHELGHMFRRNLERFDPRLSEEANKLFKVADGDWLRADEEKFARSFEKYLADGKAPSEGLKRVFDRFKQWMSDIYEGITGSELGDDLTPEIRDFFDRMLGKPTREQRVVKTTAKIRSKIAARVSDELSKQPVDRGDFSDPTAMMMEAVDGIDFNLDKILTDMESKDVYNIFSEELEKQFKKLNGGVESLQQTTDKAYKVLAEDLGVPENELKNSYRDLSNNMDNLAARLLAGKMILKTQAEAVAELGLKIDLGDAGPRQLAEFNLMIEEMAEMQGLLKNIQTQAARATSAGRIEITSSLTRQQLEEWVEKAGGSKRVHDVAKQVTLAGDDFRKIRRITEDRWDKTARKWMDIHNEGWINSILSGPVTHVVNMLSTAAHGIVRPLEKTIGGAATLNGKMAREGIDEVIGLAYNLTQTLSVYRMTLKAAKEGKTILDPGNTTYDAVQGAIGNKNSTQDFNEAFFKQPLGALKGEVSVGQAALDFVGNGVRLPGRLLTAGDEFNKQLFYRSNLFAKGLAEARSRGLSSAAERANYAVKYIDQRISEGGRATDMDSLYYSQESTFTNPLDYGIGKSLQSIANKHPYVRVILPFVRTPTNIVRQLWRHTPGLGFIQKQLREDLKSGDPRRKALAIGQQVVGSTLFLSGFMAAASGKITGGGPSDSKRRNLLRQTGWQPYSIVTTDENGNKVYTSYQRMDPWASALGLMADVHDISRNAEPGDATDIVQGTLVALAKNVTNKTYLRGMSEALGALMDPDRNMQHWLRQQAGSYVPNFANQFNPDDALREVRSVLDAVKKRTPGYSETLDPKRNTFGEPILYGGALGEELGVGALSPFYRSKGLDSPIRQEMVDLNMPMSFRKSMVQPGFDLAQFPLSPNQTAYDRWQEMVGEIQVNGKGLEEVLNDVIKSEAYQRLPMVPMDGSGIKSHRASAIKKVINSYREAALARLLRENPDLKEIYKASALNARRVQVLDAAVAQ